MIRPANRGLGRKPQFDERSRGFGIKALIGTPEVVSRLWECGEVLDQGPDGACVGFSFAHELIADPAPVRGVTTQQAIAIYWDAQRHDEWEGGAYPDAEPFYEGTSILAGAKALKDLGLIDGYRWAFSTTEVLQALSWAGPVILGLNWYEDMFDPDETGRLHVGGMLAGGHAILANGVDPKTELVRLHNSWGPSWGIDGEAFLAVDDLGRLLDEQGEACIPTHRRGIDNWRQRAID